MSSCVSDWKNGFTTLRRLNLQEKSKKKRDVRVVHKHKNKMRHMFVSSGCFGFTIKINNVGEAHMAHSCRAFGEAAVAVISGHDYQHGGDNNVEANTVIT